jgi:hypothetical protein
MMKMMTMIALVAERDKLSAANHEQLDAEK